MCQLTPVAQPVPTPEWESIDHVVLPACFWVQDTSLTRIIRESNYDSMVGILLKESDGSFHWEEEFAEALGEINQWLSSEFENQHHSIRLRRLQNNIAELLGATDRFYIDREGILSFPIDRKSGRGSELPKLVIELLLRNYHPEIPGMPTFLRKINEVAKSIIDRARARHAH